MKKKSLVMAALALAVMVAAPDLGMTQAKENASKDENRNAAQLLHNPTNFRTDRWESDGNGAAKVSLNGGVTVNGPVTAVTSGGDKISTETTLAAILAKLLAAPATEAKQDTGNTSLDRLDQGVTNVLSDTTAILAKIIAAPATEAKQDTGNTSLSNIDTNTTGLAGTVSGSEQQVDVVTLPALSAGTNLIGSVASADRTDAIMDGTTSLVPKFAIIDFSGAGDNTLVAAVVGNKIRVLSCLIIAGGNSNIRFESGASGTALSGQMQLTSNSGFTLPYNPVGWFETAVNTLLNLETSSAQSVDGMLVYVEVP